MFPGRLTMDDCDCLQSTGLMMRRSAVCLTELPTLGSAADVDKLLNVALFASPAGRPPVIPVTGGQAALLYRRLAPIANKPGSTSPALRVRFLPPRELHAAGF